jgi:DNA-binding NarL/FixJ family response regulator
MEGNGGMSASDSIRVAVQQRHRFFREGIALLLDAEPGIEVVGTAVTGTDVVKLCAHTEPDVTIIDVDQATTATTIGAGDTVDACQVAATLRAQLPALRFIGVYTNDADARRARQAGLPVLIRRSEGMRPLLLAVRASRERPPARIVIPSEVPSRDILSRREIDVLALVGSGRTTREISERLSISRKTVENHKQRIFAKLQVQNQAHAVAVAMRHGIISPEGVLDLTDP